MAELAFRDGVMDRIRLRESRYDEQAYLFVLSALEYTQSRLEARRHISAAELADSCRQLALERYGLMSRVVLERWGIHATADIGEIVLHKKGETQHIAVHGGVVEVRPNKVTVLADIAETAEDIDEDRAQAALRRAEEMMESREAGRYDPAALAALRRSNLRLKVARRRRQRSGPQFESDTRE